MEVVCRLGNVEGIQILLTDLGPAKVRCKLAAEEPVKSPTLTFL